MLRFLSLLSVLLVTGCATLSREDCSRGDWASLGINDGRTGEPSSRLDEHQKACMEYGIAVNQEAYLTGREQGLQDYCQLDNAFQIGLSGKPYHHVCPPSIDGLFGHYHSAAFALQQDRAELERLDTDLAGKERDLYDKKLSDKDQLRIRDNIRDLDRKRDRLRSDLYHHERELDTLRREASSYR
jgi:hypothetical protein